MYIPKKNVFFVYKLQNQCEVLQYLPFVSSVKIIGESESKFLNLFSVETSNMVSYPGVINQ